VSGLDLRTLLRVDAAMCVGTGIVLAAVVDGWVRAVGVFLVAYGLAVGPLSLTRSARTLRSGALLTIAGDAGWVAATILVVATGAFSTIAGAAVALGLAVPVGAMGILKRAASSDSRAGVLAAG
jgi:hypothetical protein